MNPASTVKTPNPKGPGTFNRVSQQRNKFILWGVLAVILIALPFISRPFFEIFGPTTFSSTASAVNSTLLFVLLALGLNIVVGYAGLLDLGYAAFFAIGAYTMGFLTARGSPVYDALHSNSFLSIFTNFWVALPLSFLMAALFGILLGAPTLGLRGDYLAIVTLGFGEIVPITINNLTAVTGGDTGLSGLEQPNFFGYQFNASSLEGWYLVTLLVVFFSIFMVRRLVNSRIGRAWMAMREDEIAAAAMGINLVKTKLLAFSLGASFAGFSGAIFANSLGSANPSQFKFDVSVLILAMIILGGMGNLWGVIAGAVVLSMSDRYIIPFFTEQVRHFADSLKLNSNVINGTLVSEPNPIKDILTNVGSNSRLLIFGIILVVMMLIKPEGLFPNSRRKMELHVASPDDPLPFISASTDALSDTEAGQSLNYNPSITEETGDGNKDDKDTRV